MVIDRVSDLKILALVLSPGGVAAEFCYKFVNIQTNDVTIKVK